ncbi:hypothetical protein TNCV_828361 [Trichonephila clavipes]|nr:hypothetical protein TNCV_828361 [Trichonephila clavipes]
MASLGTSHTCEFFEKLWETNSFLWTITPNHKELLKKEGIHRMLWPVRSPDLNTIETLFDALGRVIACQQLLPRTLQALKFAGKMGITATIPINSSPFNSVRALCEACTSVCIAVQGGTISYYR